MISLISLRNFRIKFHSTSLLQKKGGEKIEQENSREQSTERSPNPSKKPKLSSSE
jgi:hypothetical protein